MGAELLARRFVVGTEGNLSVRLDSQSYLTTPTGTCKGRLRPEDLVVVSRDGEPRDRGAVRPSSEWGLHREIYERCPAAGAVCHAHPPYATACAAAHVTLDSRVLTETAMLLGPVPLARPAVPGTDEVALSVRPLLPGARGLLLANHGAVAWGEDLEAAHAALEAIERLAEVTVLARVAGGAVPLTVAFLARAGVGARFPDQSGKDADSPR